MWLFWSGHWIHSESFCLLTGILHQICFLLFPLRLFSIKKLFRNNSLLLVPTSVTLSLVCLVSCFLTPLSFPLPRVMFLLKSTHCVVNRHCGYGCLKAVSVLLDLQFGFLSVLGSLLMSNSFVAMVTMCGSSF